MYPYDKSKYSRYSEIFAGIAIGLIVGLAIAMVITFYFTHSPSPLVGKILSPVKKNENQQKNFDPNRLLQGKISTNLDLDGTSLEKDNTKDQSENLSSQPKIIEIMPPISSKEEENESTIQKKKKTVEIESTNNINNMSNLENLELEQSSTLDGSSPEKQEANPNTSYLLQIGAYKTETDAEEQRVNLAFQGLESAISKLNVKGIIYYRVRIGPFLKFDEMNSVRHQLLKLGFDVAVLSTSKK